MRPYEPTLYCHMRGEVDHGNVYLISPESSQHTREAVTGSAEALK